MNFYQFLNTDHPFVYLLKFRKESEMSKPNFIEIIVVLDRSGSMSTVINDTIGGFNTFLDEQKKTVGEANLTLIQFDDRYEIVHNGVDIQNVPALTTTTYVPRGMTALFDAVMKTSIDVGERLAKTPESERPSLVIFVILTDGQENSSKEFRLAQVKDMIKHQTEKYNWQFLFLGADQDSFQADHVGVSAGNTFSYDSASTNQVYMSMSRGISNARLKMSDTSVDPEEACLSATACAANIGDFMRQEQPNISIFDPHTKKSTSKKDEDKDKPV